MDTCLLKFPRFSTYTKEIANADAILMAINEANVLGLSRATSSKNRDVKNGLTSTTIFINLPMGHGVILKVSSIIKALVQEVDSIDGLD